MDHRLVELLEFAREFSEPQGPDPAWWAERDRRETAWMSCRSTDELVALACWLACPTWPPGWPTPWEGGLSSLAANAAYLLGRAARGNRDPRLLLALLELLADSRSTDMAVQVLKDMDESIYTLVDGSVGGGVPIIADLAAATTPALVDALRAVAQTPNVWEDSRMVISAVVDEWRHLQSDTST